MNLQTCPMADEIDYKLIGDDLQAVIVTLDPGETVIAEAGAMMYMEEGIVMNTTLDPNEQGGGMLGKLFQGAKRALSGDTFFVTTFANAGDAAGRTSRSRRTFPGKIQPVDLREWGGDDHRAEGLLPLRAARDATSTSRSRKRIGAGFFGGEGFILQRIERRRPRRAARVGRALGEDARRRASRCASTPAASWRWSQRVDYDIQMVPGIKTALFGGEGLFFATLTGPGRVMLQTMPFSRLADRILAAAPRAGAAAGQQEGSVLGGVGWAAIASGACSGSDE